MAGKYGKNYTALKKGVEVRVKVGSDLLKQRPFYVHSKYGGYVKLCSHPENRYYTYSCWHGDLEIYATPTLEDML